jgi:flagellar hook assembly protein FlgD
LTATQIRYALPQRSHVKLMIYDLHGRLVRILEDAEKSAGAHVQTWDGLDGDGIPAASGVYLYRLQAGKSTLTRKMLLLE